MGTDVVSATPISLDLERVESAAQLMREELGEDFRPTFPRVRIPAGGGTAWDDPRSEDPDSPESIKELVGVIVGKRKVSRLYLTPFESRGEGDSGFPDAWSLDGKVQVVPAETVAKAEQLGLPVPLADISRCPYHRFPDRSKGEKNPLGGFGKASNDYLDLYLLLEDLPLPVQVSIPATSIRAANQYLQRIVLHRGRAISSVVTALGLRRTQNKQGIDYSEVTFRLAGTLDDEQAAALKAYELSLKPFISDDPFAQARSTPDDDAIEAAVTGEFGPVEVVSDIPPAQSGQAARPEADDFEPAGSDVSDLDL